MIRKIIFAIHFIISIFLLVAASKWALDDIFSVGKFSNGNIFIFTCPACFAIPIAFLSIGYILGKPQHNAFYLPVFINFVTVLVGIFLYLFENNNPDYAFQHHHSSFDEVIKLVESGELAVKDKGIVLLPEKYREIFRNNVVYSITTQGTRTFFFEDGYDNFDNYSWGYLYRSDDRQPFDEDKCSHWRILVPPTPHWYYCGGYNFTSFPPDP